VIWARDRHFTREEFYSVVHQGIRDRHLSQARSGNLILLTLCKPYEPPPWLGRPGFGRGGQPSAHGGGGPPHPNASPAKAGFPGRGRGKPGSAVNPTASAALQNSQTTQPAPAAASHKPKKKR
jgi:hypothetical protein